MESILSFLFPYQPLPTRYNLALLALRMLFGGLLMWHGVSKILALEGDPSSFPNPIGLGSTLSLYLVVFAEVVCAAAVIVGAFYRLALIPILVTMCVALFVAHHGQPFAAKELAFIYLILFALMYCMGAGRFSLDNIIAKRLYDSRLAIVDSTSAFRPEDYDKAEE
ncbi:MAG: DoxX family protein [Alistipes sp.]|nr:DoxX family protein [Alistipes sp.]